MHVRAAALEVQEAASSAVRRSRLAPLDPHTSAALPQPSTSCVIFYAQMCRSPDLSDPAPSNAPTTSTPRVLPRPPTRLGSTAQAQDVVQDVFLKLWRRAGEVRRAPRRARLLPAASWHAARALDSWREGRPPGRASDRLKLGRRARRGEPDERPRRRRPSARGWRTLARRAAAGCRGPARGRRARLLGRLTADRSRGAATSRSGTAKSRIRLGLARLRLEIRAARARCRLRPSL
jgi:RNA polymerase sigma-70 factor (ECF subfamily)